MPKNTGTPPPHELVDVKLRNGHDDAGVVV